MKNAILSLVTLIQLVLAGSLMSQTSIALTFTANIDTLHQALDSVMVVNLTQGGDTVLHYPDTVLVLDHGTGVFDPNGNQNEGLILYPSFPNPFTGYTTSRFFLPERDEVTIRIFDLLGREVSAFQQTLHGGEHTFTLYPGSERYYMMVVETSRDKRVQKLISLGGGGAFRIEHTGSNPEFSGFRKGRSGFSWASGDQLRFVGYSAKGVDTLDGQPTQSTLFVFMYSASICPATMTDYNGNVYNTVQIGNQCWMKENLKARNYRDGTTIPNITDNSTWTGLSTGARCWYNNDSATYAASYGALYNWHAVDNTNGLCPTGWHVPTDAEWTILTDFLGGLNVAGGALKETGTTHWNSPNTGATNSSGFTSLPGGTRGYAGGFASIGYVGLWWSLSTYNSTTAWYRRMNDGNSSVSRNYNFKTYGYSVRCVRDSVGSSAILPTICTDSVSGITSTSAVSGGNFTADGGAAVTARGVCWSTSPSPTIANSTTNDGSGTGHFTSNITGLTPSTTYYVRAYATNSSGTAYGNEVSLSTPLPCAGVTAPTGYGIVSSWGKCWLDRNLGATQVATSSTDANAYGDLYQWGRGTDGHQMRTSSTTNTLSSSDQPGHGSFISVPYSPKDWRSPQNANLWQGVNGVNNPCPTGWRVPTEAEWEAERLSWSSNNTAGAFASPLKLPMSGYRDSGFGVFGSVGTSGFCWSSTDSGTGSIRLMFNSTYAALSSFPRGNTYPVRCLKD